MNHHRSTRVSATQANLRRVLARSMRTQHKACDSRPLMCEQLERRYALHGMDWFAEATDWYEYSESDLGQSVDTRGGFAHVRSWQSNSKSIPAPEAENSTGRAFGRTAAFDSSMADLYADHCDRPHVTAPEGEPQNDFEFGYSPVREHADSLRQLTGIWNIKDAVGNQASMRPLAKLSDATQSSPNWSFNEAANRNNNNNNNNNNNLVSSPTLSTKESESARDVSGQGHLTAALSNEPTDGPTTAAFISVRVIDFTSSSRGLVGLQNASIPTSARSGFPSSSAMAGRIDGSLAASPTLSGVSNQVTTTVSPVSPSARTTTGGSDVASAINRTSETSVALTPALPNRRAESTAPTTNPSDQETQGLQAELRSLVQQLALDQAADKAGSSLGGRIGGSIDDHKMDELFRSSSQLNMFDDGMLELNGTTDRMASSAIAMGSAEQLTSATQHRSQLIASLELTREFDLAGQTVQSLKSVIDPSTRVHDARMAAEEIENWNELSSSSTDLSGGASVTPTSAQPTLWQRSILPLSFLAIGGLLMRSRKVRREDKGARPPL